MFTENKKIKGFETLSGKNSIIKLPLRKLKYIIKILYNKIYQITGIS